MSKQYCIICNKVVEDSNWRYKDWGGGADGWGCSKHFKPRKHEYTTKQIKEERYKHRDDIVQPFRQGEFSQEFKEAQPETAKQMLNAGSITKKQYKNAKPVWKGDIEGY